MFKGTHTDRKIQDVVFNFTGFGPFLNVTNNPTMELVESLKEWKKNSEFSSHIGDVRWLDVSADAVNEYIEKIIKEIEEAEKNTSSVKQVLVHLGVYAGSSTINLEKHAYNCADFRGPDNKGYQPREEKISKKYPLEHYFRTFYPVEEIHKRLANKHKVKISDDPGRYVCNYIFYTSMNEGYKRDIPSIFIHVPEFDKISKQEQEEFIKDFIRVSRELLLEELSHLEKS